MSEAYRAMFGAGDLDAALAGLAEERRKIAELQQKVNATSTVVHSKDRLLSMTFNGQGELEKLTFNGTRYRRMPATELASVIKETLTAGRNEAMGKIGQIMGSDVLPGVKFEDMATGKLDLNSVMDSFLGVALDALPERLQGPARARLQGGEH
jgi:DNA-binding protein YbaB